MRIAFYLDTKCHSSITHRKCLTNVVCVHCQLVQLNETAQRQTTIVRFVLRCTYKSGSARTYSYRTVWCDVVCFDGRSTDFLACMRGEVMSLLFSLIRMKNNFGNVHFFMTIVCAHFYNFHFLVVETVNKNLKFFF